MRTLLAVLLFLFSISCNANESFQEGETVSGEFVYCLRLNNIERLSDVETRIAENVILYPPSRNHVVQLIQDCGIRHFTNIVLQDFVMEWDSVEDRQIIHRKAYRATQEIDGLFNFDIYIVVDQD